MQETKHKLNSRLYPVYRLSYEVGGIEEISSQGNRREQKTMKRKPDFKKFEARAKKIADKKQRDRIRAGYVTPKSWNPLPERCRKERTQ